MIESDASWRLFDTIKSIASSNNQSTNAMATCVRVLSDGTRMMQLVGSSILTPLNGSMAAEISQGDMAEVRIEDGVMSLTANVSNPSVGQSEVDDAVSDRATVRQLGESNARIENLEVTALTAESATIANLQADTAKVHNLTADQLTAATAYVGALDAGNVTAAQLIADHATVGALDSTYAKVDMANVNNAWINNGTIKDGAIVSAMINDVSANKLTAGTINGSVINVTNLNADNITTGTINGQRIGEGSLSLNKLSEDVYTEAEVDTIVDGLNDRIDGAIETFTGTTVPTLNNSPASSWNTTKLRDEHVGDVYYVVNSQSQQNGYCYRFAKSGSTYSWQLIKDSDVTAALSRLTTAEGKITTFDSDISTLKTDTGTLTTRTTNLETRMSDAEDDILDKVDTTTFNEVSDTVDAHTQTISQHTTAIANKADSSTVTAVTNRVTKNEQDISGINTTIGQLQTTVESKADGSTVTTISNRLNTVSDTVDGHTQSITSLQNTVSQKADGSTVSTLQSDYATFKQQTEQFESTVGTTYATKTELNDATDDITELESRVSTNETSISNNSSAIALKANSSDVYTKTQTDGKITKEVTDRNAAITAKADEIDLSVTEKVYQGAQPNLAPLGTVDFSDVYSATTNPDGYWKATLTSWFTRLDDGWVRVYADNTSGTSATNSTSWRPSPSPSVVAGSVYTILTEIRNNHSTGSSQTDMYLQQIANNQFWGDINGATIDDEHVTTTTNISLRTCGETYVKYSYRIADTEHLTTTPIEMFRYNFRLPAGGKFDFEFRQSVYEGIYDGPYKPYSGAQLYASQAELKVTNDSISTKVDKDGVISSINQSAESVTINASKINLVGAVTIGDLASDTQDAVLNSNLQIGGRNLLTGTGDWSGAYPSSGSGSASGDTFTFSAHTSLGWYSVSLSHPHMPFSDVDGQTLTLGFDYRSDDFSDTSGDYRIWINAAASATESGGRTKYREISTSAFDGVFVPTTEWQRGSITFDLSEALFNAGSGECNYFYIQFYNHTLNSLQLRHVKLEKGNKPTDWTPAPEDVDTAVSDAAKTATSYITQVDQNGITLHPSGGMSNRVEIDADGMEVYKGNVSVASYGDTARIGNENAAHINISSDSVVIDSGGTTSPVIMTTSNGYSHIQADYIDALQYLSSFDGLSSNWLNINGTQTIAGVRFGFATAATNSNGITTFNPNLGVQPTAVFVAAGKASNETEAVAKIAVPIVWSIDSATQVQVRWQRSDTNAWLTNNAVGWYWLALA